jgi:ubiquinone/menaquinone biosynthesis C-methylase UbiE
MAGFTKYVARQFGKPTGIGGKLSTYIMNCLNWKMYRYAIALLNIQPTDTVLDIGFGNGHLIKKLLKKDLKKIYGIEISSDMVNVASSKNKKAIAKGKVELVAASVEQIPYQDASIDKICTINTLYFWKNTSQAFSEIRRILKPNGIFLNIVYTKEWLDKLPYTKYGFSKYSNTKIKEITEQNGLLVEDIIEIEKNKSYCFITKKQI